MQLVVVAAVFLLACSSKPREVPAPDPGSAAPPAADAGPPVVDICGIGRTAVANATCPTPEVRKNLTDARKAIEGLVDTLGKVGDADPRQFHVMCAQLLLALERDAVKANCVLALDAAQRAQVQRALDEWYAQRTQVTPTGDAASDAVIARIVVMRDAACECRDAACLDRIEQQLVTLPANAPEIARTLGKQLIEDAARCAARVRTTSP